MIYNSNRPEYYRLHKAIQRCHNPNDPRFEYYGARGIVVANEWREASDGMTGFERFIAHIGAAPSPKHELDRIDFNGNYEPGNVRWATRLEQMRNTRRSRFVVYRGRRLPVSAAIEMSGVKISGQAVISRLNRGWAVEAAIETPTKPPRPSTRKVAA